MTTKKIIYWDFGGMVNIQDPTAYRRDFWGAFLGCLIAFGFVFYSCQWLAQFAFKMNGSLWELYKFIQRSGFENLYWPEQSRLVFSAFFGLYSSVCIFQIVSAPRNGLRHKEGRQFFDGKEALDKAKRDSVNETKKEQEGIFLTPELQISQARESTHILTTGGTGAGKTVILTQIIRELFKRKDKAIIVDWKNDFTQFFKCSIFNPFDQRSVKWEIGRDCRLEEEAVEMAHVLIPTAKSGEPFFTLAGQGVLTGLIVKLQKEKPKNWGWSDLYEEFAKGHKHILETVQKYRPHAVSFISEEGKQTQGVLATISSRLDVVRLLAKADVDNPNAPSFSIADWLKSKKSDGQIIVAGLPDFENLCKTYIRLFFVFAGKKTMGLSDGHNRKIWFVVDEFPKLGKVEAIPSLIEFGRSKGARVVLATQDFSQIAETYGANTQKSLLGMVGTQIVGRTAGGETAEKISKELIGMQTVERRNITRQSGGGTSTSWSRDEIPVFHSSKLQTELGVSKTGIHALLLGLGNGVHRLHWTFSDLKKVREGVELRQIFGGQAMQKLKEQNEIIQHSANLQNVKESENEEEAETGGGVVEAVFEAAVHASPFALVLAGLQAAPALAEATARGTAPAIHKTQKFALNKAEELEVEEEHA
jgi:type IV secretory pathway TraG/TraD family ATPase VirD4